MFRAAITFISVTGARRTDIIQGVRPLIEHFCRHRSPEQEEKGKKKYFGLRNSGKLLAFARRTMSGAGWRIQAERK